MLLSYAMLVAILNIIAIACALWFGTAIERKTENTIVAALASAGILLHFGVTYLLAYNYITSAFVVTSRVVDAWFAAGGALISSSIFVAVVYVPYIGYRSLAKAQG